ncbi:MAG: hypothetical protein ACI4QY_01195 [Oscillospiraceae bacterium]
MSDEKLSLKAGIEYMDRCLDAELASQRAIAHSAIDMDDWSKAQEILAASKEAISRVEVLRGKFAEFKKAAEEIVAKEGETADSPAPAAEPAPAEASKAAESAPAPAAEPAPEKAEEPKPAAEPTPAPAAEPAKPAFSFVDSVEELIEKHSFAMAVCNAAPNMNNIFTYDEITAKEDMKKPVQLSNGLWAETSFPEDKARLIVAALRKYCESRKQG